MERAAEDAGGGHEPGTGRMWATEGRAAHLKLRENVDCKDMWCGPNGPVDVDVAWICDGPRYKWWRIIHPFGKWSPSAMKRAAVYSGNLINLSEAVLAFFVALLAGLNRLKFPAITAQLLILPSPAWISPSPQNGNTRRTCISGSVGSSQHNRELLAVHCTVLSSALIKLKELFKGTRRRRLRVQSFCNKDGSEEYFRRLTDAP